MVLNNMLKEFSIREERDKVFGDIISAFLCQLICCPREKETTHLAIVEASADTTQVMVNMPVCEMEGVFTQEHFTDDIKSQIRNHMNQILNDNVIEILSVDNGISDGETPMVIATILYHNTPDKVVTYEFAEGYLDLYMDTCQANLRGSMAAAQMIDKQQFVEAGGNLADYKDVDVDSLTLSPEEKGAIRAKFDSIIDYLNNPANRMLTNLFGKNKLDEKFDFVQIEFNRGLIVEYNKNRENKLTVAKCDIGGITCADILQEVSHINKEIHDIEFDIVRFSKNSLFIGIDTTK